MTQLTWPGDRWSRGSSRTRIPVPVFLLALTTGAVDAFSFLALGGVFTSVMTANMALLGLAAGSSNGSLAGSCGIALVAYACGVVAGSRLTARAGARVALLGELAALCALAIVWVALGGEPHGGAKLGLLAVAALAMGGQSGIVKTAGPKGVSTTYMTGALTGLISALATGGRARLGHATLILMLPVGAALSGALVTYARQGAGVLPVALMAAVLALSATRPSAADAGAGDGTESPDAAGH